MAMTSGLFHESVLDRLAHSSTSYLLSTKPELQSWAACVTDLMYEAGSKFSQAGGK